jgi:hypothetical protein
VSQHDRSEKDVTWAKQQQAAHELFAAVGLQGVLGWTIPLGSFLGKVRVKQAANT